MFFRFSALKSNMDRFIANPRTKMITEGKSLKSNMDRFIEPESGKSHTKVFTLKSNMDRFIENLLKICLRRTIL